MSGAEYPDKMDTLSECLTYAISQGFTINFKATPGGLIYSHPNGVGEDIRIEDPAEVTIQSFYRFEGQSDPADNAILYLLETVNGIRGTLVDGYGPTADKNVSSFITKVEEIQKNKLSDL